MVERLLTSPAAGERGLASRGPAELAGQVVGAWDGFLALAAACDLDAPSRLPGWSGRDVLVHLGSWPDHRVLDGLVASARAGAPTPSGHDSSARPDADARNAAVVARHRDAGREEVLDALRDARERTAAFLHSVEAGELATTPVESVLGTLPLLTVVSGSAYELAVHALDLAPCGAAPPGGALLRAGLGALVDVTGALAARFGIRASLAASTPVGGWAFRTAGTGGDWAMAQLPAGADVGDVPSLTARAEALLDASAGRVAVPPLLARRELRAAHVPELLILAPLAEQVPGLPGGAALRAGVRSVSVVGGLVRRLPRWRP